MLTREITDNKTLTIKSSYHSEYQQSRKSLVLVLLCHLQFSVLLMFFYLLGKLLLRGKFEPLVSCLFRSAWLPARVADISCGGLGTQFYLQLILCQSGRWEHWRQRRKSAPRNPRWPRRPGRFAQWDRREDKQAYRVSLHEVMSQGQLFMAVIGFVWKTLSFGGGFCLHHVLAACTFKCLCNLCVVLLVVGIQCLEYCVVLAQSFWTTVGSRGHHPQEPQLEEHRAAFQLPTTCCLCLQGIQIWWEITSLDIRATDTFWNCSLHLYSKHYSSYLDLKCSEKYMVLLVCTP